MRLKDIKVGTEVAVQLYGSRDSLKTVRLISGEYSYPAQRAIVVEVGVHGQVYHGRSFIPSMSTKANYVKVAYDQGTVGRVETVINTKIIAPWNEYAAEQREICDARTQREQTQRESAANVDTRLKEITAQLGLSEYELPSLSSGGRTYSPEEYARNKRQLVKVLELALAAQA